MYFAPEHWFTELMAAFTQLGNGPPQLLAIAAFYWAVDRRTGIRLALLFMGSAVTNGLLKQAFAEPRPAWIDPELQPVFHPSSFGMPSGHAQSAATWLLMPYRRQSSVLLIVCALYAFLMGWSRVVTGVHTWNQVMMGWSVGIGCIILFRLCDRGLTTRQWRLSPVMVVLAGLALTGLIVIIGGQFISGVEVTTLDAWREYAARVGVVSIGPVGLRHTVVPMGCLIGMACGGLLDSEYEWARPAGVADGLKRITAGFVVVGVSYAILMALLPANDETAFSLAARFVGAALLGWVCFYVVPACHRLMAGGREGRTPMA